MQMPNSYTYRFFYKIGFYMLLLVCAGLCVAWIGTSVSRDDAMAINRANESTITTYRILLQYSVRKTDIMIDIYTSKEPAVWEIYCEQIRDFKLNHARRHGNDN